MLQPRGFIVIFFDVLQQLSSSSFSHMLQPRGFIFIFFDVLYLRGFIFIFFDVLQPGGFISIFFNVLQHPSSFASLTCCSNRHHLHLKRIAATVIICIFSQVLQLRGFIFILTYVALERIHLHLFQRVAAAVIIYIFDMLHPSSFASPTCNLHLLL